MWRQYLNVVLAVWVRMKDVVSNVFPIRCDIKIQAPAMPQLFPTTTNGKAPFSRTWSGGQMNVDPVVDLVTVRGFYVAQKICVLTDG